jgi:hypothetical protein
MRQNHLRTRPGQQPTLIEASAILCFAAEGARKVFCGAGGSRSMSQGFACRLGKVEKSEATLRPSLPQISVDSRRNSA